jgi:outer membrane protein assembly factor BamB
MTSWEATTQTTERSGRRRAPVGVSRPLLIGIFVAVLAFGLVPASQALGAVVLGTQTVSGNLDENAAGSAEAFGATATGSGPVGSLSVYIDSTSRATEAVVGLYSDSGGKPGTLLTQGTISSPTAGWNTVPVSGTTVTAGTPYWITLLPPSGTGTIVFRDAASGSLSENSSQSNLTTLPSTWSAGAKWANSPISAYASVTAAGPVLSVTPAAVSLTATAGGSNPPPTNLSVSNTGSGSLSFSASSDSSWLSVSPTSGTAPQSLSIGASIAGLSAGTYSGHVTVTATGAQGSPQVIPVTLTVSTPVAPGPGDWPMIEHDLGRSGTATDETQINNTNASLLAQNWSTTLDGKVTAQPLFLSGVQVKGATHDVVIAATNQNTVYGLDATTGAVLWSRHLLNPPTSCGIPGGFGISGTPVVDRTSGRIYAVTDDGTLHILSLADGSDAAASLQFITNPATNYVWGGLSLVNGALYIPTASDGCDDVPWQGGIYQIGVTGSAPQLLKHWITVPSLPASQAGGGIWGYGGVSVDTASGHVYAASSDDATGISTQEGVTPYAASLLALDSNLNLLGWYQPPEAAQYPCAPSQACDQDFAATPLVFHPAGCPTMLAAGSKNGNLYVTTETSLESDGGSDGSHVQAIQLNQSVDDLGEGGLYGTPAYSPSTNLLYVVDSGSGITGVAGGLVALSVQPDCSVKVAWSQPIGTSISDSPNSTPTIANGVVFVGANDGSVRAFDAATGSRLWNSGSVGFAVYAAPIVAHGRVITGAWSGSTSTAAGTIRAWTIGSSPSLGVSPASLSFSATAGGSAPSAQTLSVTNQGSGTLTFTTSSDSSWLGVSPPSGQAPATLTVQATVAGLTAGTYNGNITVTPSTGAPVKIPVTLTVTAAGLKTLIGDGNVEPTADNNTAGLAEAFPATATSTGSMVQLRVYVDQGSAASRLVAGLYTSVGGHPAQLLTQGTLSNPVAGAWNTLTVPAASVTSGTGYWIAILSPAGSGRLTFRDRVGGGTAETSKSTTLTTLPTTWTTGHTWSSSNLSATGLG